MFKNQLFLQISTSCLIEIITGLGGITIPARLKAYTWSNIRGPITVYANYLFFYVSQTCYENRVLTSWSVTDKCILIWEGLRHDTRRQPVAELSINFIYIPVWLEFVVVGDIYYESRLRLHMLWCSCTSHCHSRFDDNLDLLP